MTHHHRSTSSTIVGIVKLDWKIWIKNSRIDANNKHTLDLNERKWEEKRRAITFETGGLKEIRKEIE